MSLAKQVYNGSLFTNLDASLVYVTALTFLVESESQNRNLGWTIPNLQMNLSTTQKSVGGLSTNFSDNVGSDDRVVFGPKKQDFPQVFAPDGPVQFLFDKPFRYNPALGNLLLDVRIFDGSGQFDMNLPYLEAFDSATDEVSRVWATNVTATSATARDTLGLTTILRFDPVPFLRIYTSYFGTPTNWFAIEWPTQPTVFVLQRSLQAGPGELWQTLTNVGGGPNAVFQRYYFPVDSAGATAFYRLIWPFGQ